jgi:hypothetical protein
MNKHHSPPMTGHVSEMKMTSAAYLGLPMPPAIIDTTVAELGARTPAST